MRLGLSRNLFGRKVFYGGEKIEENIIPCFSVEDIVIKSILSAHEKLKSAFREQASSSYSCYKLLGYDILLDHNFKPHLIGEN